MALKVTFDFNPFKETGISVPKHRRAEALDKVSEFVKTEALSFIGDGESPVDGGAWKESLSPEYAKEKKKESGVNFANLELHGDMLDTLGCKKKSNSMLTYGVLDKSQAGKADGNNRGTYGQTKANEKNAREFIPIKGKTFRPEIWEGIRTILETINDEEDVGG